MKKILILCAVSLMLIGHSVPAGSEQLNYPGNLAPFPTKSLQSTKTLKECGIIGSTQASLRCFYLQQGPLTRMTDTVREIADSINNRATTRQTVKNIMTWLHKNLKGACDNKRNAVSADTILARKCASGCTDYTIAFAAIARFKGIPATVTETVSEAWIVAMARRNRLVSPKEGHFFSAVYLPDEKGAWVVVDVTANKIVFRDNKGYYPSGQGGDKRYMLLERGLDPADYGLITDDEFAAEVLRRYYIVR